MITRMKTPFTQLNSLFMSAIFKKRVTLRDLYTVCYSNSSTIIKMHFCCIFMGSFISFLSYFPMFWVKNTKIIHMYLIGHGIYF